jgi:hypothetical protein
MREIIVRNIQALFPASSHEPTGTRDAKQQELFVGDVIEFYTDRDGTPHSAYFDGCGGPVFDVIDKDQEHGFYARNFEVAGGITLDMLAGRCTRVANVHSPEAAQALEHIARMVVLAVLMGRKV